MVLTKVTIFQWHLILTFDLKS